MKSRRPSWLLALVFVTSVVALVVIEALELDHASETLVGLVVPILTALFILDRVDARSDSQDEALSRIDHATNGLLTSRLDDAVQPLHDKLDKVLPTQPEE